MDQMLDEGANWDPSQWQQINVGGGIERVMVPKGTPVWTGYQDEEWRHPGIGQPTDWQQQTFDNKIEKYTKIITEAKQALKESKKKRREAKEEAKKRQPKEAKEAKQALQESKKKQRVA